MAGQSLTGTFWKAHPDGVRIAIRVQPRARRTGVQGVVASADGPRLRIAVNEPPEDGKANRAVCSVLAEALQATPSGVSVIAGASSREKLLFVGGDPTALAQRLAALG